MLRVNLTKNRIRVEPLPKVESLFLGGKGLGAYLLYKELSPRIDPLGPKNKIIIVTGPLQGSVVPICGRYAVVTKSPLTGLFLDTHAGGSIGPELKFAGFDAVIIEGKSPNPCLLTIKNEEVELHDGTFLKKTAALEKEKLIQKKFDENFKVMSIGTAGENQVKFACVTGESFRNLGRGGLGAVFGSKNLLSVAIKGPPRDIPVADPDSLATLAKGLRRRATTARKSGLRIYRVGTPNLVRVASNRDQLPVRNFQAGTIEDPSIIGEEATTQYETKKRPCYVCPISCAHIYKKAFSYAKDDHIVSVPEYETLGMLGSNCGMDIDTIIEVNYLANNHGLDTISLGNTIAFFMEVSEKNKLPEKYQSERVLFGDKKGLLNLIHKIVNRDGIGDILAQGTRKAAEYFGNETEKFAVNVKGLEMAAWDPRGKLALGLSYATAAVGASHLRGWPSTTKIPRNEEIRVPIVKNLVEGQDLKIIKDCLIICHFTHSIVPELSFEDEQALFSASTGSKTNIRHIAQNIWSLTRLFNMREFEKPAAEYDQLPHRILNEPLPSGSAAGSKAFVSGEDFKTGLQILYKMRHCESNGDLSSAEQQRIKMILER